MHTSTTSPTTKQSQTADDELARYSFDLDVPAGHYSQWTINDIHDANRLVADIAIITLRKHTRWRPAFGFHLLNEEEMEGGRVSFIFTPTQDRQAITGFLVAAQKHKDRTERVQFPATFAPQDTIQARLSWTSNGKVTGSVGKAAVSTTAPWLDTAHLRVTSSTGQMNAPRLVLQGESTNAPADVKEARARWQSKGMADYKYRFRKGCFCTPSTLAATVVVRNDTISSIQDLEVEGESIRKTGRDSKRYRRKHIKTIEQLFDMVEGSKNVEAQFDSALGYPTHLMVRPKGRKRTERERYYSLYDVVALD